MLHIHRAGSQELRRIFKIDALVRGDQQRRGHIRRALRDRNCLVAIFDDALAGYLIMEQSFFANDFVALLFVAHDYRRRGIGRALMEAAEASGRTEKIFTSTNQSNQPMRKLLGKLEYARSGIIYNLDPGDPELVYMKMSKKSR
ncbi:MAG TPA: GNAT family N-acetyltransferase [Candidatus Binataceae bacterium]|nr:GNAT family N-acetyltransferase [Candidatus Binataceae bacterium]